jgi:hypothetical protein
MSCILAIDDRPINRQFLVLAPEIELNKTPAIALLVTIVVALEGEARDN